MKKNLLLGLVALTATSAMLAAKLDSSVKCLDSCKFEHTGKSYMAVRPLFQSASPELVSAFREDFPGLREDGRNSAFQAVIFGSKSSDTDDFSRYFTPFCHNKCPELYVDERDSMDAPGPVDLRATHFNIFTKEGTYRSKISMRPERSEVGLGLAYRQDGIWRDDEKARQFFWSINAPITHVKTSMNLKETPIDDGGGIDENADVNVVANMIEAFKQSEWEYGRINSSCGKEKVRTVKTCGKKVGCDSYTETKIGDIELKLGIEWVEREPVHMESYIGLLLPTGNRPEGRLLFEPIVGHGKHFGVMFGSSAGIEIWRNEESDRVVRWEMAGHSQYLFKKTHIRAVDLKCKPWSRYMEVYKNKEEALQAKALCDADDSVKQLQGQNLATPGINVFTFAVDVTPGFSNNVTSALVLSCGSGFQGELGYNFFNRRSECVKFGNGCKNWESGPALKHEEGCGKTNPVRDITGNFRLELGDPTDETVFKLTIDDYEANQIKESDFDLNSAAQPCMLTHTFFGVLGYRWDEREYPMLLSGGASYEFSSASNASLERWVLWGKLGFAF